MDIWTIFFFFNDFKFTFLNRKKTNFEFKKTQDTSSELLNIIFLFIYFYLLNLFLAKFIEFLSIYTANLSSLFNSIIQNKYLGIKKKRE